MGAPVLFSFFLDFRDFFIDSGQHIFLRDDEHKLEQGKFKLKIRKNSFTRRTVRQ